MKVYLVEFLEPGSYLDYDFWIEKVFSNYQSAHNYLLCKEYRLDNEDNWIKGDGRVEYGPTIIEMEVED